MAYDARDIGTNRGKRTGGGGAEDWDVIPIYHGLAAAYGWTYEQIDLRTLRDAQELWEQWPKAPPTFLLVRAIVEGFGGKINDASKEASPAMPATTKDVMTLSAQAAAAGVALPVVRGSRHLPKAEFDVDKLRQRNADAIRNRR